MKNLFKRVTSFVTAFAMTMTLNGGVQLDSFADELNASVTDSSLTRISIGGAGEADNALALEYYINSRIMGNAGISTFQWASSATSELFYPVELDIYDYLCEKLTDVADGNINEAVFSYSVEWNYSDIGLDSDCTTEELRAAAKQAVNSINYSTIYDCLLADLPYELYWHDKTKYGSETEAASFEISARSSGDGSVLTSEITFSFLVAEGYGNGTTVNDRPAKVQTAVSNMESVVGKYAGKSDLEILIGYKEEICAMTGYNSDAAQNDGTPYGDPWQLIYVFDNDPATTVVCEGYSKAFKQLCDMTTFSKDIYCYLVTGATTEEHMWNIVQIGNEYYHADITNCDSGNIGADGGLFLDGVTYTNDAKTIFSTDVNLAYVFDSDTLAIYPVETASLSAVDYSEEPCTSHIDDNTNNVCDNCSANLVASYWNPDTHAYEYFTTLNDALARATDPDNNLIDILADTTLNESVDIEYPVNFKLNGYTVTIADNESVNVSAKMWINNGTIKGNAAGGLVSGSVYLEMGDISVINSNADGYALALTEESIIINCDSLILTGGKADIIYASSNYIGVTSELNMDAETFTFELEDDVFYNDFVVASYFDTEGNGFKLDPAKFIFKGNTDEYYIAEDVIDNDYVTYYNVILKKKCAHSSWTDGICNDCGEECEHQFDNGTCDICKLVCKHDNQDDILYSASEKTITAECICGKMLGTIKLTAPTNCTYDGTAKIAVVSNNIDGFTVPETEYYSGTAKLDGAPENAGTYTAKLTIGEVSAEIEYTIEKADAVLGTISVTPNAVYDSMTIEDITLSYSNSSVIKGKLEVDKGQTLTAGNMSLKWTFIPDNENYNTKTGAFTIMVNADKMQAVALKSAPTKTEYYAGDEVDLTGMVITATYLSNDKKDITYSEANKKDFTFTPSVLAKDTESVTVTYNGMTVDIPVKVSLKELSISFPEGTEMTYGISDSIKIALYDGEKYVTDGTSGVAIYGDSKFGYMIGTSAPFMETIDGTLYKGHIVSSPRALNSSVKYFRAGTINAEFVYEGTDIYAEKTYPFTITVNKLSDYEDYLDIKVNGKIYTSTAVSDADKLLSGKISIGDDVYTGTVAFAESVSDFTTDKTAYSVIFTPDDENIETLETTVTIEVEEDSVEKIELVSAPDKLVYAEGDAPDLKGLVIKATYASGAEREIEYTDASALQFSFTPAEFAFGDTKATVSYGGKTVVVDGITVKGKLTADMFIFTAPENLTYDTTAKTATVEPVDSVTGIGKVTVKYYNGETELTSAPVDAGKYKVAISVAEGDKYAPAEYIGEWDFTVEKATPAIMPGLAAPSVVYDTTDVSKITISSGTDVKGTIAFDGEIILSSDVSSYPVVFKPEDSKNYNEAKGTVKINVVKDVVAKISVTTAPVKTAYTYGDDFDPTGLVITETYTSGRTIAVPYKGNESKFSFAPDELTVETTAVKVKYAGKETEITGITVAKAEPSYVVPAGLKAVYGDTLADITLAEGWSWDNVLASVGSVGTNKFTATYDNGDPNYTTVSANLEVKVSPKSISIDSAQINDKVYDGTTEAIVNKVAFSGLVAEDSVDYTASAVFNDKNAGENKNVTVTVTLNETNYVLDKNTFTATASISKADPVVTTPITVSAVTDMPLSATVLPEGWKWNDETVIPVDGNKYGATYIPEDTTNYNSLTTQITVNVSDCTHSETTEKIDKATCTEDGLKTVICKICEETVSAESIPSGHEWNEDYTIDVQATCTTDGSKSIHCRNCTEIKKDSVVTILAGHAWNQSYTSDGNYHWIECANCNEVKNKDTHSGGTATTSSRAVCTVCKNSYGDYGKNRPSSLPVASDPWTPVSTEPEIKGENGKTGWKLISDELVLANDGDTVVVDMNGTTRLPKSILEAIEGRNVYIVLDMGSGIMWTINGETITTPKNIDMRVSKNVKRIPVDIIDNVTGDKFNTEISLAHNGEFGFEAMLTISLGRKHNDKYANLYYYNRSDKAMEFIDCDLIANGEAQLIFNHASDYAIVIDEEALGDDVSSAAGVTAESEVMENDASVSVVFALPLVLAAGFVIRKKFCR